MDFSSALGLVVATALLGLSPGPAVFATMGRAITSGLGPTYLFIAGIIAGDFVFAMLAMLGLAAIVGQYAPAFLAIKICGGLYLLYLGWKAWRSAGQGTRTQDVKEETGMALVTSGFLLTASNPKDLLFFVSFLPAFVDLENTTWQGLILPASLIVVTFLATLSVYALGAFKVRTWFSHDKAILWLNRVAGITIACVGVAVLLT